MGRLHGARRTQIPARATAKSFIRDAKNEGTSPDVAAACRIAGRACLSQGDFSQARAHLEEALRICDPEWDVETRGRHGTDCEISATAYLAHAVWQFGEVERARQLIDHVISRAVELGHIPTLANAYLLKMLLEMFRGERAAVIRDAETLSNCREGTGLRTLEYWNPNARLGARSTERSRRRRGGNARSPREICRTGKLGLFPALQVGYQSLKPKGKGREGLWRILMKRSRWLGGQANAGPTLSSSNIRGDILLKVDPENPARAEEAYLAAIAVAQEQGARSFGLQAALSLCEALPIHRPPRLEAHDILAPELEGFEPRGKCRNRSPKGGRCSPRSRKAVHL